MYTATEPKATPRFSPSITAKDTITVKSDPLVEAVILPVPKINVDSRYQRELNERRVARMAAAFDPGLAEAISVSLRDDGTYWVFDGQHRLEAARRAGRTEILCLVHILTPDEEARRFERLNSQATKPSPLDLFKARLFSRDPIALGIDETVRSCGFEIDFRGRTIAPGYISAIAELEVQYRSVKSPSLSGRARLSNTLTLIKETWPDTHGATGSVILRAVDSFLQRYPGASRKRFAERLGAKNPVLLARKTSDLANLAGTNAQTALLAQFVHEYNHNLRSGRLVNPLTGELDEKVK
jgi:hypothetical protein